MDNDVDMDAPQISTLREEESPPPATKSGRFRVKLVMTSKTGNGPGPSGQDDELDDDAPDEVADDDDEDQEDQLIDDEEDQKPPTIILPARSNPASTEGSTPQKRKSTAQPKATKRPRKNDHRQKPAEEGKLKEKVKLQPGGLNLAPTMSMFEVKPSEQSEDPGNTSVIDQGNISLPLPGESPSAGPSASAGRGSGRKRGTRKTGPATTTRKPKATKAKLPLPPQVLPDEGIVSEGVTGTAASSPVTASAQLDGHSPEPDPLPPPAIPVTEDITLDGVPVPVYPLPTKPFPVQAAVKIASGFAPIIPLDRNGKKVRKWRTANREIRGIGGGRWFSRCWVGEKESEFATAQAAKTDGVALPKLSSIAIGGTGTGKGTGKGKKNSSVSASSRATSAVPPDAVPGTSISVPVQRVPTKMRNVVNVDIASEAGDSDMLAPSEP